jgi:glycerol-3-phosphate cytidylyltransferase-like family protein
MNTRAKLVKQQELEALLECAPAILVIGTFDPLLAVHADRMNELAEAEHARVVVAVADADADADAPATLLSLTARQEMVAALRMVDFVLPYAAGLETALPWKAIHDDTALHHRWTADLKEHVRRRSQPA